MHFDYKNKYLFLVMSLVIDLCYYTATFLWSSADDLRYNINKELQKNKLLVASHTRPKLDMTRKQIFDEKQREEKKKNFSHYFWPVTICLQSLHTYTRHFLCGDPHNWPSSISVNKQNNSFLESALTSFVKKDIQHVFLILWFC